MAELKIEERTVDGVVVLSFNGKPTIGEGSVAFRDAVSKVLSEGAKKIILDWSGVSYIDSSGIGEMVSTYTRATKEKCILAYAGVTQKVWDLASMQNLFSVLPSYPSVDEAVQDIKDQSFEEYVRQRIGRAL